MEIKTNKIDAVKQEVEFEVPYKELTPHFEKAYEKYRKKLRKMYPMSCSAIT